MDCRRGKKKNNTGDVKHRSSLSVRKWIRLGGVVGLICDFGWSIRENSV